jgi:hypothetical protein
MRSSRCNAARHCYGPGEICLEVRVVEIRTEGGGEAQGQLKRVAAEERRGRNKRERKSLTWRTKSEILRRA